MPPPRGSIFVQIREPDLDTRELCRLVERCVDAASGRHAYRRERSGRRGAGRHGRSRRAPAGDSYAAGRVRAIAPSGFHRRPIGARSGRGARRGERGRPGLHRSSAPCSHPPSKPRGTLHAGDRRACGRGAGRPPLPVLAIGGVIDALGARQSGPPVRRGSPRSACSCPVRLARSATLAGTVHRLGVRLTLPPTSANEDDGVVRHCRTRPRMQIARRSTLTDFGERLRRARESRGISLRQVANVTRITVRALEAVERNDLSRLPGGIFTRAFVRAYAAEVGLDPESDAARISRAVPRRGRGHPDECADTIDGTGAGSWVERVPIRQLVLILLLALAGAVCMRRCVEWAGAGLRQPRRFGPGSTPSAEAWPGRSAQLRCRPGAGAPRAIGGRHSFWVASAFPGPPRPQSALICASPCMKTVARDRSSSLSMPFNSSSAFSKSARWSRESWQSTAGGSRRADRRSAETS